MSANKQGGQGTQKSGQKPLEDNEQGNKTPGQPGQQRDQQGQGRQQEQNRPEGGKQNR
jgi:hypothetical protein